MKPAFMLQLVAVLLMSVLCASAQVTPAKKEETKAKIKTQNVKMKVKGNLSAVPLPYEVGYSSQFMPGNPAHAKLVLDIWKDFDNNTFERNAAAFADTVIMMMSDGTTLRGLDQTLDAAKSYRSSLRSVESTIDAVMASRSIDRDEDWVLVWGTTKETDKNGRTKTALLHEAWRIGKDRKINYMMQFARVEPKL